jgi:sulfate/thiosulfate transport system ATP-binding protein
MSIQVRELIKRFGSFTALDAVTLELPEGELVALLGPSGSGKTTLLRVIAGLDVADSGAVLYDGRDAAYRHVRDRRVGFVFQHYALFGHMTVFENVAFGLRVRSRAERPAEEAIRQRVADMLDLVQLDGLAERYPAQLSGGQRQRVALARALAIEPRILLLDEPFGALDAKVREELRRWLRRLHQELRITCVLVTHDQDEALEVADRLVIMNRGRIEQVGTPDEVYEHPVNPFVCQFLGSVNVLRGHLAGGIIRIGDLELEVPEHGQSPAMAAYGCVRPHDLVVQRHGEGAPGLPVLVKNIHVVGPLVRLEMHRSDTGEPVEAHLPKESYQNLALRVGEMVFVKPRKLRVFPDA